ncbi:UDP-galactose 4-epimerase [Oceanobacillus limi]|uniref:UDP-glucose 4-epimerase n=1 Tax=Oceanobacillus limi TaxID=930131 RepID=A0A1I0A5Q9_9BACI|nr:UDP-glucose 4-epimerase GalE [Oceanobacillus limi]SES89481.1 UDP-galactose 4-epimerase [Oceanobacillus limi]
MAILITGGAGYIGAHICVELLHEGYDIVVVDNFSTSNLEGLNRVKYITGKSFKVYNLDITDSDKIRQLFSKESIDSVIHLAGYKSVSESTATPLKYYANNIAGTITLCEVMQEFGVKRLVFSSSATVYAPSNHDGPISEDHPLGAINPYGQTKEIIEGILRNLYLSDQTWSIRILRYFNPVGAHESGQIGENPKGIPNNLMPYIAKVAGGELPVLSVYGSDYPTKDGTGIRDYIHVVDLARGHLHALKAAEASEEIDMFNLGTGRGYSVLEMVEAFERASGRSVPYILAPRRKGDTAICYADVSKAKKKLGWEAKKGINQMCHDAWQWDRRKHGSGSAGTVLLLP